MDLSKAVSSVLREESLENILINKFGVDQMTANELMKGISFSDYLEIQNLIDAGDTEGVANLVGVSPQTENSYSAARKQTHDIDPEAQQPNEPIPLEIPDLKIGDPVGTDKGPGRVMKVQDLGDTTTYTTDKNTQISTSDKIQAPRIDPTDDDAVDAEIERLQQLAGIDSGIEEGGVGNTMKGGALASGAMSGAVVSKNKIKKMTHKNMKPGPKPKKRR